MELHNPPKLALPPLMIEKQSSRAEMERSPDIVAFMRSNLLLDNQFHALFMKLALKSSEIQTAINSLETITLGDKPNKVGIRNKLRNILDNPMGDVLPVMQMYAGGEVDQTEFLRRFRLIQSEDDSEQSISEEDFLIMRENLSDLIRDRNEWLITGILDRSREINDSFSQFEKDRKIDLDIVVPEILFLCIKCARLVSHKRFHRATCECGSEIAKSSDVVQHTVAVFRPILISFIEKNYWFEHGIDYLLRKKNYQTLCGYHVLGHSGTTHEIDVIAESVSARLRLFCECKTGPIGANDVFVLAGKMNDIGCSRGYIFTLSESVSKEISLLARSRNISVVTNVLERPVEELLQAITGAE